MKHTSILAISAFVTMLTTGQATASDADIKKALAGKTLVSETSEFKLGKNGRLTGKAGSAGEIAFKGAWAIRDGKWCRTLTEPKNWAGTECQRLKLGNGTVTITGRNGPSIFKIK